MSISEDIENIKIAVTIRTARAALGISQQAFADKIGVSKSTIARMETLEMLPKADVYMKSLKFFKELGLDVDSIYSENIVITITPEVLISAKNLLDDETKRRSDRLVSGVGRDLSSKSIRQQRYEEMKRLEALEKSKVED